MEYKYSFSLHGVNVELTTDDHEELEEGLQESIEFIEDNADLLDGLSANPSQNANSQISSPSGNSVQLERGAFGEISERTQVDSSTLSQLITIPDSQEENPFLKLYQFEEGPDVLGTSRQDRQAKASLILLYVMEEARGIEEVQGDILDEALHDSGIDSERRDNMYRALSGDADRYFDRGSGIVSLRPRGRQAAREVIQELATEFES